MTGYAQLVRDTAAGQLSVEIRSVNSRFLDLSLRMPDELRAAEPALRAAITAEVSRGKVECRIGLRPQLQAEAAPAIDARVLAQLADLTRQVSDAMPRSAPPSV
ncbi:MAG: hypothetical protein IT508_09605, partial [Burkholderiaceae bacterium]|nr:hypothetical protein [Burkholderiaceae bacterium]